MSSVRGGRCGDETSPGRQTEAFLALIALLCITSAAIGIILNSFLQQLHISTFVHCVVFLCLGLIPSSLKKTGTQVLVKAPTLADDSNVGDSTNLIDKAHLPPPTPRTPPWSPCSTSSGDTIAPWRPGSIGDAPDGWSPAPPAPPLADETSHEITGGGTESACMPAHAHAAHAAHAANADLDSDLEDEMLLPCPPRLQRDFSR